MAEAPKPDTPAAAPDSGPKPRAWEGLPPKQAQQVRDEFCLTLRQAGYSMQAIAKEAGYADRSTASKAVSRAIETATLEPIAEFRVVLLGRLDRLLQAYWRPALAGDRLAADFCRKLIETQAIMTGANAPTKLEVFTLDAIDQEIRRLETEIQARDSVVGNGHKKPKSG